MRKVWTAAGFRRWPTCAGICASRGTAAPSERETLRELTEPNDLRGLVHAVGHLGLWAATGLAAYWLFTQQIWWGFLLALFAHGTVASFFTAPHHELCHTTVFRTRRLNELFLVIFSLLGWLNFHVYRFSHSYHHRFTLFVEGDREEVMPVTPLAARALPAAALYRQRHRRVPVPGD